jgi:hypothetical protein
MANPQHLPSVCDNSWKTSYENKWMIFSISYTFTACKSKGDFEQKVEAMNKVTENLIEEHD